MEEHIAYIRMALRRARSDDLERAKMSFKDMTNEQFDDQYGQSGQTFREILAGYQQDRDQHDAAVEWFESVVAKLTAGSATKECDDE